MNFLTSLLTFCNFVTCKHFASYFPELHPEQAGHFVCEEGDESYRGARLRHKEDPFQDGGRGRAAVPEEDLVPVFRRDHVDPLHGFLVGVRSGTNQTHLSASMRLIGRSDRYFLGFRNCKLDEEQHFEIYTKLSLWLPEGT